MKLEDVVLLTEDKGSSSFDYKYWFWAKKGPSTYGIGYARQDVKLDIAKSSKEIINSLENIKSVLDDLNAGKTDDLEVVERKIKPNIKRVSGIVDLFNSPIVIHWFNNDPPTVVTIPREAEDDVTDSKGRRIDLISLFNDANTREFVTKVIDWGKVKINPNKTTVNSILANFLIKVFSEQENSKNVRSIARSVGLDVMKSVSFDVGNIKVRSFTESDYNLLPQEYIGSKKIVSKLKEIISSNFNNLLKTAIERVKQ